MTTPAPGCDGTMYTILKEGSGKEVTKGAKVTVHATGVVKETGKKFWSTKDAGQEPFSYQAGVGQGAHYRSSAIDSQPHPLTAVVNLDSRRASSHQGLGSGPAGHEAGCACQKNLALLHVLPRRPRVLSACVPPHRDACTGEERQVVIPGHEGYGAAGFPAWGIPPGGTLDFTLEVLKIS